LPRRTLNLGILAHVDAGKTTLTERLLHAAGVIDEIGSVDAGTTQTDSLELERRRGITIKSAVVSFTIDDVPVNLIDTPGHPDFIAEVERVLSVLDGAVLVISAVEGVQPQTRVLMRALRRLRTPTLLFVNKIDRGGADPDRVLGAISRRLSRAIVPIGHVPGAGTRAAGFTPWGAGDRHFRARLAEVLAGQSDSLLAAYVEDEERVTDRRLREELVAQAGRAEVYPVFFGSAITGAGVAPLMAGLVELLPAAAGDPGGPLSGSVFKIERGPGGEKVAYARMFSGTVRTRDRVCLANRGRGDGRGADGKVTAISVFDAGVWVRRGQLAAGEIGKLWGLGEVQKEVIQATLANDFGIEVTLRETTTICVERPAGTGEAVEILNAESNPFHATVALRVEPGPAGSGIDFRLWVDPRTIPMYVYKSVENFTSFMAGYVRDALREGLSGWQVTDCVVTLVGCGYSSADGPPSTAARSARRPTSAC
jgi:ribosomal protection tetracycline resistance protein